MDLFAPVVPEKQQHSNFRFITQPGLCVPETGVIKSWADGFVDRDGKFVREFQTTFNSSFWELYLFACFKELGCTVDFSYPTPDFVVNSPYGEFIAEATTANHPKDFRPEWDKDLDLLDTTSMEGILRLSTIRLLSVITDKHKKYTSKYSKLAHVQKKPFVICVAPFEQPFFFFQDALAIVRVLYAYEQTLTIPGNQEGEILVVGESRSHRVQKKPGLDIPLGLFTNSKMTEVSAIIFNNRATFCKLRALAGESKYPVLFFGSRAINSGRETGVQRFVDMRPHYQETLLDGLQILLNPFAKNPLDLRIFENREFAIHSYEPQTENYLLDLPDGFLLQRMCQSFTSEESVTEFKKSLNAQTYQELPIETWAEDELLYVGGQNGSFRDNHMAHYCGWTILVSLDSIDEDWSALAVNTFCYSHPQFIKANGDDNIASIGISEWLPTKEEAYAAIKHKIERISK